MCSTNGAPSRCDSTHSQTTAFPLLLVACPTRYVRSTCLSLALVGGAKHVIGCKQPGPSSGWSVCEKACRSAGRGRGTALRCNCPVFLGGLALPVVAKEAAQRQKHSRRWCAELRRTLSCEAGDAAGNTHRPHDSRLDVFQPHRHDLRHLFRRGSVDSAPVVAKTALQERVR